MATPSPIDPTQHPTIRLRTLLTCATKINCDHGHVKNTPHAHTNTHTHTHTHIQIAANFYDHPFTYTAYHHRARLNTNITRVSHIDRLEETIDIVSITHDGQICYHTIYSSPKKSLPPCKYSSHSIEHHFRTKADQNHDRSTTTKITVTLEIQQKQKNILLRYLE